MGTETGAQHLIKLWAVYLSSVGKNLRRGFEQNIHQLSTCIINMLMHQNEFMGVLVNIVQSTLLLASWVCLAYKGFFVICSPDFSCPCVQLAQITLLMSVLYFPDDVDSNHGFSG